MYDELIKRMRDSEHEIDCSLCDRDCCYPDGKVHGKCIIIEASDAIEELSVVVRVQKAVLDKFPRWIPVTERLPEERQFVLAWKDEKPNGFACVSFWMDNAGWAFKNITHWMPLPEPPEKESEP